MKKFFVGTLVLLCFISCGYKSLAQCWDTTYDYGAAQDVLFEDNFKDSNPGDYPQNWRPAHNKDTVIGAITIIDGAPAFDFSLGSGYLASPKFKAARGSDSLVTFEFDYLLKDKKASVGADFLFDNDEWRSFSVDYDGNFFEDYNALHPIISSTGRAAGSKWHHFAISFTQKELKCYIDNKKTFKSSPVNYRSGKRMDTHCDIPKLFVMRGSSMLAIKNVKFAETQIKIHDTGSFEQISTNEKFVTHSILFDVDKANIKTESLDFIKQLKVWLQKNPAIKMEIDGHTDSDGNPADNILLSQRRAEAVKDMLVSLGVKKTRLSTKGFGADKPLISNETPEGKARNRRVEFIKL